MLTLVFTCVAWINLREALPAGSFMDWAALVYAMGAVNMLVVLSFIDASRMVLGSWPDTDRGSAEYQAGHWRRDQEAMGWPVTLWAIATGRR